MNSKFTGGFFLVAIAGITFSCAPTNNVTYFKTYKEISDLDNPDRIYYKEHSYDDRIQPGDLLYITVATGNDEPNNFNQTVGQAVTDIELLSHTVDNQGYIKIPYLDKVKVANLTLEQAIDTLEAGLSQFLYLPVIKMSFSTSRITVLGEVNAPGVYTFNRKSVSIYQAIAYAGDIATYGNRKKVSIIRNEGNNILKKKIDLTNDKILSSTWYNIRSNDIIYVEPMKRKVFGMETFDLGLIYTTISTIILLITFNRTTTH